MPFGSIETKLAKENAGKHLSSNPKPSLAARKRCWHKPGSTQRVSRDGLSVEAVDGAEQAPTA